MGLADRIIKGAGGTRTGPRPWIERLPPKVASEILEVRRKLKNGELDVSARSLASSIIAECKSLGVKACSVDHLRVWLTKD